MDELVETLDDLFVDATPPKDPVKAAKFKEWQDEERKNPQPFALIRLLRKLYTKETDGN